MEQEAQGKDIELSQAKKEQSELLTLNKSLKDELAKREEKIAELSTKLRSSEKSNQDLRDIQKDFKNRISSEEDKRMAAETEFRLQRCSVYSILSKTQGAS